MEILTQGKQRTYTSVWVMLFICLGTFPEKRIWILWRNGSIPYSRRSLSGSKSAIKPTSVAYIREGELLDSDCYLHIQAVCHPLYANWPRILGTALNFPRAVHGMWYRVSLFCQSNITIYSKLMWGWLCLLEIEGWQVQEEMEEFRCTVGVLISSCLRWRYWNYRQVLKL